MSNIDTLLDAALAGEAEAGKIILDIDEASRTVIYSGKLLLGVEDDDKAERIYFKMPRYVHMDEDVDISLNSVKVFINYKNATLTTYISECTDKVLYTEDMVMFSWLLTKPVTELKGKVSFSVCIKNIVTDENGVETIKNEWHTDPFEGEVLEGINVDDKSQEEISDPMTSAYQVNQVLEEVKATSKYCEEKASEVSTFADGLNSLQNLTSEHTENIEHIQYDLDDTKTSFNARINLLEEKATLFKFIERISGPINDPLIIADHIKNYNELMIVIRLESDGNEIIFGLSPDSNNTSSNIQLATSSNNIAYSNISMNKTSDGHLLWKLSTTGTKKDVEIIWDAIDGNSAEYGLYKFIKGYCKNSTSSIMTIVIYGR